MQNDKKHSAEDIEHFKKHQVLQRSVNDVRKRAEEMDLMRRSPNRYNKVKSQVAKNLKSGKQAALRASVPSSSFGYISVSSTYKMSTLRDTPFEITNEEMARVKQMKTVHKNTKDKLKSREQEINQKQKELDKIKEEFNSKRPVQDKILDRLY